MSDLKDPHEALAALDSTNERISKRMSWPLWRHLAGGFLMTLIVAAVALPKLVSIVVFAIAMILMALIVRDDKKRYGMFVSGYQRGKTVWTVGAIVVLILAALVTILTQFDDAATEPGFWVTLLIVFLGTSGLSVIWERVYRMDVREGRL